MGLAQLEQMPMWATFIDLRNYLTLWTVSNCLIFWKTKEWVSTFGASSECSGRWQPSAAKQETATVNLSRSSLVSPKAGPCRQGSSTLWWTSLFESG